MCGSYEGDGLTTNTESKLAVYIDRWRHRNKNISWTRLFQEAGLAAGTAIPIRSGKEGYQPDFKTLNKLADYMGESRRTLWEQAGYVVDADPQTSNGLNSEEQSLIDAYRELDEHSKGIAYELTKSLSKPD